MITESKEYCGGIPIIIFTQLGPHYTYKQPNKNNHATCESSLPRCYCILGHVTEEESLFNYRIGDTSYSAVNDGYLTHTPLFYEDLNVTQEVEEMCQRNPACIYDSIVTGSTEIGLSTLDISTINEEILRTLGKFSSKRRYT